MRPRHIVLGGGGHARVLIEVLKLRRQEIAGICDPALDPADAGPGALPVLGGDEAVHGYDPRAVLLVNSLGSAGDTAQRRSIFDSFAGASYRFATVVHPDAIVATDAVLGEGAQIMAGAVIQPGTRIGKNSIVNTRASVDHDCRIGAHAHIAPGATLCGGVEIGDGAHVGAGAVVIQGIRIGATATIGAGVTVRADVEGGAVHVGTGVAP